FGREEIAAPRPLDLRAMVGEIEPMVRSLIGERIELEIAPGAGTAPVFADRAQIEQVLVNLVINARDAMPDGGRLRIEVADLDLRDAPGRESAALPAGGSQPLSVTDTGLGMDETTRARLFEPFFTTKAPAEGTGLGMSIVHGIVTRSGGEVAVTSALGRG